MRSDITSSGTDAFLKTTYKVGNITYHNFEGALAQFLTEQKMTSGSASIEVEQHYEY